MPLGSDQTTKRLLEENSIDAADANAPSSEPLARPTTFPIVGIGASAGGLEAFRSLFAHLPATTDMAYIVVQHLDPHRPGLLPGLLSRVTKMPVCEGQNDMLVQPNHVYVIPPNADLLLENGALKLLPRTETRGQHLAINTLFCSLAEECKQQAIGVLLSGTGSDGTIGLQAIKTAGGIAFAQDAHSARYPQMPQSAIAAGCVDCMLPPEEIARELAQLSTHASLILLPRVSPPEVLPEEEQILTDILLTLRGRTGVDFLEYKPATLKRRIEHRMTALHLGRLGDYAGYLNTHQDEVEALYQDVLVHVTSFFRDPEAFDALNRLTFPEIVEHHVPGETLRIWVPGCSTGEEAYSLAICLIEFLEKHSLTLPIQLFATDINPRALSQARTGIYPSSSLATVSKERLERFFTPVDQTQGTYRIAKGVREWCVFALHNMVKDPPFSHLDLISCRNVLIYLGKTLQQKALQTFHYALSPHGFLLLGTSESVDPLSQLFADVERRQKLYRKKTARNSPLFYPVVSREIEVTNSPRERGIQMPEEVSKGFDLQQEADHLLLTHYVPASVVVDANMEILHVRGRTGSYLELAPGKASFNLLKMARAGLLPGLRTILHTARKENRAVMKESLQVSDTGTTREVRLSVVPIKGSANEPYFLVLFEEVSALPTHFPATPQDEQGSNVRKRGPAARRISALEQELAVSQAEMQAMLEERNAANEELQAANEETLASNEELQSVNEELQSVNEELQTSKEELQAINEELTTTNQELETRNEQIRESQEYADAIVETVREPLLVLNADLRVQRANTAFYLLFGGVPQEVDGQYFYELGKGQWNIPQLRTLLEKILVINQSFHDFEVEHNFSTLGHRIMLLNGRRIRRDGQPARNQLILLAIEDITERKEMERRKDVLLDRAIQEHKTPQERK
jgi:two-component system CheB/CheR fusion protein